MKRKKPRLFWFGDNEDISVTADTVLVSEDGEDDGFTGLLDAEGEPIFRAKVPFGFQGKQA